MDVSSFYCSQLLKYSLETINLRLPTSEALLREVTSPTDAVTYIQGTGIENNEYLPLFFLEKRENEIIDNFSIKK